MANSKWGYILINGSNKTISVKDAETTKRNSYKDFFKKPFKNFAVLSGRVYI